jgi:hypothetical protein
VELFDSEGRVGVGEIMTYVQTHGGVVRSGVVIRCSLNHLTAPPRVDTVVSP